MAFSFGNPEFGDSIRGVLAKVFGISRHADCILMVAWAEGDPSVSSYEEKLETFSLRTTKELVLLHPEDTELPKNTSKWLEGKQSIKKFILSVEK